MGCGRIVKRVFHPFSSQISNPLFCLFEGPVIGKVYSLVIVSLIHLELKVTMSSEFEESALETKILK